MVVLVNKVLATVVVAEAAVLAELVVVWLTVTVVLVAVEAVPDIFRTVGNVSGDMAATVIAAKGQPASPPEEAAAAPPG